MANESTSIWFQDPTVLFKKDQLNQIWPKEGMSRDQKINAITRLVIILTVLGYLVTQSLNFFITGAITLGVIVFLYYAKTLKEGDNKKEVKEAFTNPSVYNSVKCNFTNPTEKNPLMNVLLPEIKDDPKRKMAAPAYNRAVEKQINNDTQDFVISNFNNDKKLKKKLFSTLGDSFEFEDFAQHTFFATPNTTIPNDQNGFAQFCYGDMVSGKDGNDFALMRNNPRIGSITGQN
jgi:hypothetical protein|uniref:Minor capsid protein P9 transmembrane helices domain-containing protein n=1 Tax=viral metagenome TaxID=1070528 RepID=A0A6C0CHM7_9ZZZZ